MTESWFSSFKATEGVIPTPEKEADTLFKSLRIAWYINTNDWYTTENCVCRSTQKMDLTHSTDLTVTTESYIPGSKSTDFIKPKDSSNNLEAQNQGEYQIKNEWVIVMWMLCVLCMNQCKFGLHRPPQHQSLHVQDSRIPKRTKLTKQTTWSIVEKKKQSASFVYSNIRITINQIHCISISNVYACVYSNTIRLFNSMNTLSKLL